MPGYRAELQDFQDDLKNETGPDSHRVAATDRIYASPVRDIDPDTGIGRYREHEPGEVGEVPVIDGSVSSLRIEFDLPDGFGPDDLEQLVNDMWGDDRYTVMDEETSILREHGDIVEERTGSTTARNIFEHLEKAYIRFMAIGDRKRTPGQLGTYTIADHGTEEDSYVEAEKTNIGLIEEGSRGLTKRLKRTYLGPDEVEPDEGTDRYLRIIGFDRDDPDMELATAAKVAHWLDEEYTPE
ncbi:MAG: hypothetical protein SVU32_01650 [Candidatus Nanohaloarchaea archaeon]|nr:hypothetical protein [Candidatus Nanohaloarchaea archaeon]